MFCVFGLGFRVNTVLGLGFRNNTVLHGFDKVSQSVIFFNVCYTAFQFNLARGKKVGRLKINLQNLFS